LPLQRDLFNCLAHRLLPEQSKSLLPLNVPLLGDFLIRLLLVSLGISLQDLIDIEALLGDFVEVSEHCLLAVLEHQDSFASSEELQLVRNQDYQFVLERFLDAFSEDAVRNCWVDGAQGIVEQINVRI
jgi:hypothetical protein